MILAIQALGLTFQVSAILLAARLARLTGRPPAAQFLIFGLFLLAVHSATNIAFTLQAGEVDNYTAIADTILFAVSGFFTVGLSRLIERTKMRSVTRMQSSTESPLGYFNPEDSSQATLISNAEMEVVELNQAAARLLGIPREELYRAHVSNLVRPEEMLLVPDLFQKTRLGESPRDEWHFVRPGGERVSVMVTGTPLPDGRVKLTLKDVSAERASAARSQQEQDALAAFARSLRNGAATFDNHGRITIWNTAMESLTGRTSVSCIGQPATDLLPLRERAELHRFVADALAGKANQVDCESIRNVTAEAVCLFDIQFSPLNGSSGKSLGGMVVYNDVTERAEIEKALRKSEQFQNRINETSPYVTSVFDLSEKRNLFANRRISEQLGYSPDEIQHMGDNILPSLLHPDDVKRLPELFARWETATDDDQLTTEYRMQDAAGNWRCFLTTEAVFKRDENSKVIQIIGTVQEITERKRAERALQDSEAFLRISQQVSHIGSWEWNLETNEIKWSDEMYALFGVSPDLFKPELPAIKEFFHPNERERLEKSIADILETGEFDQKNYRIINPDGRERLIRTTGELFRDDAGKPVRLIGINAEVADRQRGSTERIRLTDILEATPDIVAIADTQGQPLYVNPAGRRALGIAEDGPLPNEHVANFVTETLRENFRTVIFPQVIREGLWRGENLLQYHNDKPIPVSQIILAHHDENGNVRTLSTIARDISREQACQEELQTNHRQLEWAQTRAKLGCWEFYPTADKTNWSRQMYSLYTRKPDLGPPKDIDDFLDMVHPDDRATLRTTNAKVLETGGTTTHLDYRTNPRRGPLRYLNGSVYRLPLPEGEGYYLAGTVIDITYRKMAEESLRQSEEKYRRIVETAQEGIWMLDGDGYTSFVNPRMAELLDCSLNELIGRHLIEFVDDNLKDKAEEYLERRREGISEQHEFLFRTAAGTELWAMVNSTAMMDAEGEFMGTFSMITDLTKRRAAELGLRWSEERLRHLSHQLLAAQETERRRLATELHDEFGQVLSVAKINLDGVPRENLPEDAQRRLNDSIGSIDKLIRDVRALALDLSPSVLDDLGLAPALRWLVNHQAEFTGFQARFTESGLPERLDKAIEIGCYRVAQEALSNVSRHAEAKNVSVDASIADGKIVLRIADDGKGFDSESARTRASEGTSLGLLGMEERVNLLSGSLSIASCPGEGSTVEARIPLGK